MQQAVQQNTVTPVVQGSIAYPDPANENLATWVPDVQERKGCHAHVGDMLGFPFDGSDTVIDAVLLVGPKNTTSPASPFQTSGPVPLQFDQADQLFVTPALVYEGLYGFSIAFTTENPLTKERGYYFLPDPELSVGSI